MGFPFPPTPSRICIQYNAPNQGWNPPYLFRSPICFFESLSWRKRNFAIESGSAVTKPLSWRYFSPRLGSKLNCFTPQRSFLGRINVICVLCFVLIPIQLVLLMLARHPPVVNRAVQVVVPQLVRRRHVQHQIKLVPALVNVPKVEGREVCKWGEWVDAQKQLKGSFVRSAFPPLPAK